MCVKIEIWLERVENIVGKCLFLLPLLKFFVQFFTKGLLRTLQEGFRLAQIENIFRQQFKQLKYDIS